MDQINDFLTKYDLPKGVESPSDKSYIITLKDSDQFSKVYNTISSDNSFTSEDTSAAATKGAMLSLTDGEYELQFMADFEKDIYKLIISRR